MFLLTKMKSLKNFYRSNVMKRLSVKFIQAFLIFALTISTVIPSFAHALVNIVNIATGKYLDSNTSGNVYALHGNGGHFQLWDIAWFDRGVVSFRNYATDLTLDSNGNGDVYALTKNGGNYQKWQIQYENNGNFRLRNEATGRYLDSNGDGKVYTLPGNGGNFQLWRFVWH